MADDIRQLLHEAEPGSEPTPDFPAVWDDARRQRRWAQLGGAGAGLAVLAAAVLGAGLLETATPSLEVTSTPGGCPVTIPAGDFVPPAPYPETPTTDDVAWYGTAELWTVLDVDGDHVPRKSVWWSEDFEGGHREPNPEITVSWERLDDPEAPPVTVDRGTNAHTLDDGWFMIAGIDPEAPGCWRVTATYRDAELSYVFLVEPPE